MHDLVVAAMISETCLNDGTSSGRRWLPHVVFMMWKGRRETLTRKDRSSASMISMRSSASIRWIGVGFR